MSTTHARRSLVTKPAKAPPDPEQYQRFLETARELGCDENADRLDEVVKRAAKLSPHRNDRLERAKRRGKVGSEN